MTCPDCETPYVDGFCSCGDAPAAVEMPTPPGGVVIDVKRNDDGTFAVNRRPDA